MSDIKEIRQFVTAFRSGVLGRRSSHMMCFAVCAPLAAIMPMVGYSVTLTEGEVPHAFAHHTWLTLPDGRIIDPTADQFLTPTGQRMPKVYIGEKPEWYLIAT